jgi:hypothetical protein
LCTTLGLCSCLGSKNGVGDKRVNVYMRSRSSLGRDSRREKDGSNEAVCDAADGLLVDGFRRRTGRLGDFGGASSMAVSEEPLLPVEERECDRGVEVREAISTDLG